MVIYTRRKEIKPWVCVFGEKTILSYVGWKLRSKKTDA